MLNRDLIREWRLPQVAKKILVPLQRSIQIVGDVASATLKRFAGDKSLQHHVWRAQQSQLPVRYR